MSLSTWRLYLELTHLNHSLDAIAIYLPCATGVVHAAAASHRQTLPLSLVPQCLMRWLPISVLQTSFGNTVNDILDQDLDRKVSRCWNSLLAWEALSTTQASILLRFKRYQQLYLPAGKRVTNYPQVILGAMFAAGFTCGNESTGLRLASQAQTVKLSAGSMMGVLCLWVVMLDVIYAFQDIGDDPRAGVRSMSVRFQNSSRRLFTVFGGILHDPLFARVADGDSGGGFR
ncbi:hypothetical protein ASPACDRAFT_1856701 [Aspergillus aculeatus ATCC 16872]|uniref:Uncharacterized protein n=1 Tax=Aspergillus aculeatus (strain ATCC 16872 / CBS 172.66 / WB 5094) TaxID=690307 RepID=A0A1L9WSG0_ASPA1|nr:uncharacterized protein ASPACDRAFT_1856701 [Aspergillus aculeatus ATCC 16872]OJJ99120.1 hypothetical protein ASPACDRAFT_1856701 [Aspergillus aculeatus ATCC 16872]